MAVVAPRVAYRQLRGKSTTPLQPRFIVVHTMAGTLAGTESWFSGSGRAYSHFGIGGSGEIRQWQDLRYRAASDLNGNPYSISIETEDMGSHFPNWSGSDVPAWTNAQVDALVVLLAWLCARFGLPKTAIRSSCVHERGIGWHRFGIDHSSRNPSAPGGPWRNPSCPKWSSSGGKVCPSDRRIAQIRDQVLPRLGAGSSPQPEEGFLMAVSEKDQREALERIHHIAMALQIEPGKRANYLGGDLKTILHQVTDDTEESDTVHDRARRALLHSRRADQRTVSLAEKLDQIEAKLDQLLDGS